MWKEEESIFCQKVDVAKNKNLEDVTEEQLQAEARFIVQHPGFEETDEGWLRPLVSLQNIAEQRFPGFRFLFSKSCCFLFIL